MVAELFIVYSPIAITKIDKKTESPGLSGEGHAGRKQGTLFSSYRSYRIDRGLLQVVVAAAFLPDLFKKQEG